MKKCKFCELADDYTVSTVNFDNENSNFAIQIFDEEIKCKFTTDDEVVFNVGTPIKYCPYCGRKLSGRDYRDSEWDITLNQLLNSFSGLKTVYVYDDEFEEWDSENNKYAYDVTEVLFALLPNIQTYKSSVFLKEEYANAKVIDCKLCEDDIVRIQIESEK